MPLSTSKPGISGHPLPGWAPPPLGPVWKCMCHIARQQMSVHQNTLSLRLQTNTWEYVLLFFANGCGFQGDFPHKSQHTRARSEPQAWWLCCTTAMPAQGLACLLAGYQAVVPRAAPMPWVPTAEGFCRERAKINLSRSGAVKVSKMSCGSYANVLPVMPGKKIKETHCWFASHSAAL